MKQITDFFAVSGMACSACAVSVESSITSLPGVESAAVNYAGASIKIVYDADQVSVSDLADTLRAAGYELIIEDDNLNDKLSEIENKMYRSLKQKLLVSIIFTLPVFIISMYHNFHFEYKDWVLLFCSLPVVVFAGSGFYNNAWNQAKQGRVNMDTLVALSTGIAFLFSVFSTIFPQVFISAGLEHHVYYESATVIITFILSGKFLEERSKSKASSVIRSLMNLQPKSLTITRDEVQMELPLSMVIPGDKIIVYPGACIPVDGIVISGDSYVDESMISGEAIPIYKTNGNPVFAGTMNKNGSMVVAATKNGKNTLLAGIIAMVKEAQACKPPIQKLADKISSVFVPAVLLIAFTTFIIWWQFGPDPSITLAFLTTISVLIIACPCALGLATPTALITGIGRGASQGILIRNSDHLEIANSINAVIFDKTGTLTTGKPTVVKSKWFSDDEYLKQLLYTLEKHSNHPLAEAISLHLKSDRELNFSNYEEIPGNGIKAVFNDTLCLVGNNKLLEEYSVEIPAGTEDSYSVFFAYDQKLIACFSIEDTLRSNAKEAIKKLSDMKIEVYMLTGDKEPAAKKIAGLAGIRNYYSEVLPSDKNRFVKELTDRGYSVAMIGDGINDSAAMAEARLGIAMSTGSDIAIDSAGIILMNGDLRNVAHAINLSKATVKIIRQNFFWAFFYNIIAIPVAAGILYPSAGFLLSPMIAGAAMALSSVSVVMNSLRLKKIAL